LSFDAAVALRKSATDHNAPLITRREKEVLELIAEGMTNIAIAQKLFISISTVDTHRKNLLAKFDVKNTALLIKIAVQMKLV
jgi:DNA-binding CsgD family transcriptional regulator